MFVVLSSKLTYTDGDLQTFPSIDTINTEGAVKAQNSRILGQKHSLVV